MPIGNELYLNNSLELLKGFIFGSYQVYKRKGILSGYGLRKEDFNKSEKKSEATTKMFSNRINEFLESRFVKKLEHKSGRDKYYSITPLGIVYFCSNYKKISADIIWYVMNYLEYYYKQGKPSEEISYIEKIQGSWRKLIYIFPESELITLFTRLFKNIKQEKFQNGNNRQDLEINLSYKTIQNLIIPVTTYNLFDDKYSMIMDDIDDGLKNYNHESNENKFNYNFAKFILKAYAFSIVEHISYKIMIADTGKRKSIINKINKIPLEIHGMALEFTGELNDSQNKTSYSIRATSENIHQLLKTKGITTIHEIKAQKNAERTREQWDAYFDVVDIIDRTESTVYTKTKVKKLMFKTKAWKDKKELDRFWTEKLKAK